MTEEQQQGEMQIRPEGEHLYTKRPEPPEPPMPASIAAALVVAQAHAQTVLEASKNEWHDYRYASMDDMIREARGALAQAGLGIITERWQADYNAKPRPRIHVQYLVVHKDGESWRPKGVSTPIVTEKGKHEDKAEATALTYNLGYFQRSLCNLARIEKGTDVGARNDHEGDGKGSKKSSGKGGGSKKSQQQPPEQDIDSKTGEVIVRAKPGSKHQGKDLREMSLEDLAEYMETVEGWLGKAQGPKQAAVRTHLEAVTAQWLRKHETADLTQRFEAIEQRAAQSDDPWVKRMHELAEREYLARLAAEKGESRKGEQVSSDDTSTGEAAE